MTFAALLHVALLTPTLPTTDEIGPQSWFLRAGITSPDHVVLAFSNSPKDKSLGRVLSDLSPLEDGGFEVELAAILHERPPIANGKAEYVLTVPGTRAINHKFCISTAMQMARYRYNHENRHVMFPLLHGGQFLERHREQFGSDPYTEPLPTVIAARYIVNGHDADEALLAQLDRTVDDFVCGINAVVGAHVVSISGEGTGLLVPVYDRGSFPWIYLLVRGGDNKFGGARLATDLFRTQLVPDQYDEQGWTRFLGHLCGKEKANVSVKALCTAESYVRAGVYDFALLLLAIAVETATSEFVYAALKARGVSQSKLNDIEGDLTFSIMLNTQVMALAPADKKPDRGTLGKVDRIRKLRNELMHKGKCALTNPEITALISVAKGYLAYLETLPVSPTQG